MYINIFFYALIQVMVATVRCEEIGNEKLASFTADEVIIDLNCILCFDTRYRDWIH